jgi:hypothetical protein
MRVICSAVAPCRLRTKQSLWVYLSLALKTPASGQYRFEPGQLKCSKKGLALGERTATHIRRERG